MNQFIESLSTMDTIHSPEIDTDLRLVLGIVEFDISTDGSHPDADECDWSWDRTNHGDFSEETVTT